MKSKYEEYLICKERGHVSNGVREGYESADWTYCKWCGSQYSIVHKTEVHEIRTPKPDGTPQQSKETNNE